MHNTGQEDNNETLLHTSILNLLIYHFQTLHLDCLEQTIIHHHIHNKFMSLHVITVESHKYIPFFCTLSLGKKGRGGALYCMNKWHVGILSLYFHWLFDGWKNSCQGFHRLKHSETKKGGGLHVFARQNACAATSIKSGRGLLSEGVFAGHYSTHLQQTTIHTVIGVSINWQNGS